MHEYEPGFFDYINEGSTRSAEVVVPLVGGPLGVRKVLDVGCGQGAWLEVWRRSGAREVLGIDGPYVDPASLRIPAECFRPVGLSQPIRLGRRFDLVQCLEVAEHLPPESSATLVGGLVGHGSLVLFSAATPGQGGEHHVNERPHEFWRDLFRAHGYALVDCVRPAVRGDARVEHWYRYNAFLFAHRDILATLPEEFRSRVLPEDEPIPRMEPLFYRLRCGVLRHMPQSSVDALVRLKHSAVVKARQWAR